MNIRHLSTVARSRLLATAEREDYFCDAAVAYREELRRRDPYVTVHRRRARARPTAGGRRNAL
jgi:hypothetical protein